MLHEEFVQAVQNLAATDTETVKQFLEARYGQVAKDGWSVGVHRHKVTVQFKGAGSIYRWTVKGGQVLAVNGPAIALSPDRDIILVTQERRLVEHASEQERAVYAYCNAHWADSEDQLADAQYALTATAAANHFGMPLEEVVRAFDRAQKVAFGIA